MLTSALADSVVKFCLESHNTSFSSSSRRPEPVAFDHIGTFFSYHDNWSVYVTICDKWHYRCINNT